MEEGQFETSSVAVKQDVTHKQSIVLFVFNLLLSTAHGAQAIAVLALSAKAPPLIPVMFYGIGGPPASGTFQNPVVLFSVRVNFSTRDHKISS